MAAVHCSIFDCMCGTIAGIGVETHGLAHPMPTLHPMHQSLLQVDALSMRHQHVGDSSVEEQVCCICSFFQCRFDMFSSHGLVSSIQITALEEKDHITPSGREPFPLTTAISGGKGRLVW